MRLWRDEIERPYSCPEPETSSNAHGYRKSADPRDDAFHRRMVVGISAAFSSLRHLLHIIGHKTISVKPILNLLRIEITYISKQIPPPHTHIYTHCFSHSNSTQYLTKTNPSPLSPPAKQTSKSPLNHTLYPVQKIYSTRTKSTPTQ